MIPWKRTLAGLFHPHNSIDFARESGLFFVPDESAALDPDAAPMRPFIRNAATGWTDSR
jgi:hypothetical protein